MIKYVITICLLALLGQIARSQASAEIELTNGSIIQGTVDSIYQDGSIAIRLGKGGQRIYVAKSEMVRYDLRMAQAKERSSWNNRQFHNTTAGYMLVNEDAGGLAVDHTVHYRWKPRVHVGVGAAILNYRLSSITNTVALYGSARAYAIDSRVSPYVDVRLGYGFSTPGEEAIDANGGGYLQAQLGYKFEASSIVWHFYTGYHQQSADYQIRSGGESLSDIDVTFHRLVFGVALGF